MVDIIHLLWYSKFNDNRNTFKVVHTMTEKEIKERIKALLKQKNMNMSDLSQESKMSKAKISKVINGEQNIKLDDLLSICYAMGINPASLISTNMDDNELSCKEIKPINSILRLSAAYRINERKFCNLLNNELMNTITQYIDLKGYGQSIYSQAKKKRHDLTSDSGLVSLPKVLITGIRAGQLFASQLSVGYWFPDDTRYVYLSINYVKNHVSSTVLPSSAAIRNMIDYFNALTSSATTHDCYKRSDLTNSPEDIKMLDVGTILYKKYRTDVTYIEDDLKKDLQDMYDNYLNLLNESTKRVQTTYENMYQRGRDIDRSEKTGKDIGTFDRADLDRIMPIDTSTQERHIQLRKAKKIALELEGYKCEINEEHPSFIDRITGKNYMETIMLIPSSAQSDYMKSLDVNVNICCLCPMCKAKLNHASDSERQEILMELYLKHRDKLKEKGLDITPLKLFKYYGMK